MLVSRRQVSLRLQVGGFGVDGMSKMMGVSPYVEIGLASL